MKVAFACWEDRIAPVFDTARTVVLVEINSGGIVSRMTKALPDGMLIQKAGRLVELGVHTLVCGAISQSFLALIVSHGIAVIPFVAGDMDEVIKAWHDGDLITEKFVMPGCCGRGIPGRSNRRFMSWRKACGCSQACDAETGDDMSLDITRHGGKRRRIDSNGME